MIWQLIVSSLHRTGSGNVAVRGGCPEKRPSFDKFVLTSDKTSRFSVWMYRIETLFLRVGASSVQVSNSSRLCLIPFCKGLGCVFGPPALLCAICDANISCF